MRKIVKRLMCFILIVSATFTPVVSDYMRISSVAYADTKKKVLAEQFILQVCKSLGYLFTLRVGDFINELMKLDRGDELVRDANFYQDENGVWWVDIDITSDGEWVISEKSVSAVNNAMNDYMTENPDFVMIPTTKKSMLMPSNYSNTVQYEKVSEFLKDKDCAYVNHLDVADLNDTIFVVETSTIGLKTNGSDYKSGFYNDATGVPRFEGAINFLSKDKLASKKVIRYSYRIDSLGNDSGTNSYAIPSLPVNTGESERGYKPSRYYFYTSDGKPLYLFKDAGTAINYVYGKASIYRCTPTWEGGDLVIDAFSPEAYQQMVDAIIEGITEALGTGGGLSPEDIQRIIDAILGIGGTVGEGTEEQKKANSWLEKIYDKLCDIKAGTSDVLLDKLDDIESQLKQIKVLLGLELIWDVITDLIDRVNSVANALVTRFPFSIPWDIKLLYDFCAHTPETPRFEIPVNINLPFFSYQSVIEVDIGKYKAFDVLHKISRGFLTLWFIAVLLSYTRKIVQGLFSQ